MGVEDMSEDLTTSSSDNDLDVEFDEFSSWGAWFCSMKGNEFFCEVDEEYIRDGFNLSGLSNQVPWYEYALDVLTDGSHSLKNEVLTAGEEAEVEASSEILYGLIHARYIITARGLNRMLDKYKRCDFGRCPRVMCSGQPCLPVGLSDVPRQSTVKLFCPHCEDVFYPRSKYQGHVDGAYFGTTFPHLFLMTFPQLRPEKRGEMYVPKVFGFKISPLAYSNNTKDTVSGGSGRHVRTRGGEEQESRGNKNAGSTSTSGMKKSKQQTG